MTHDLMTGLVGYYNLEEVNGAVINQHGATTFAPNGTVHNTPTRRIVGMYGCGYKFTGNNAINLGVNSYRFTTDFSVSVWAKFDTVPAAGETIFSRYYSTTGCRCYFMGVTATNQVFFNVYSTTNQLSQVITSANAITLDTWYNLVFIKRGTTMSIFINGVSVKTITTAPLNIRDQIGSLSNLQTYLACVSRSTNTPDSFFRGCLDEIAIWNYGLADVAPAVLYNDFNNPNMNPPTIPLFYSFFKYGLSNLTAQIFSGNDVLLSFNDVYSNYAIVYNVYRKEHTSTSYVKIGKFGNTLSYRDTTQAEWVSYDYYIEGEYNNFTVISDKIYIYDVNANMCFTPTTPVLTQAVNSIFTNDITVSFTCRTLEHDRFYVIERKLNEETWVEFPHVRHTSWDGITHYITYVDQSVSPTNPSMVVSYRVKCYKIGTTLYSSYTVPSSITVNQVFYLSDVYLLLSDDNNLTRSITVSAGHDWYLVTPSWLNADVTSGSYGTTVVTFSTQEYYSGYYDTVNFYGSTFNDLKESLDVEVYSGDTIE